MTKNGVSQKELYQSITDLSEKIDEHFDKLENKMVQCYNDNAKRIGVLELWKSDFMARVAVVGGIFMIAVNVVVVWVKDKLFGEQ